MSERTPAMRLIALFRFVALLEGLSWLGLLIGMYFKYLTDAGELGVKIFGPIHGGVFVAYVLLTLVVSRQQRWSFRTLVIGLVAAVPPFATVVFEAWAQRSGRLSPRDAHAARRDGVAVSGS